GRAEEVTALEASKLALEDAGLRPSDIDGMTKWSIQLTSENAIARSLGVPNLRFFGEVGYGGGGGCGVVGHAAAAITAGMARSRLISDLLRLPDCCLEPDGAAAVIVAAADMARDLRQKPAYITAAAQGMGPRNWTMNNYFKEPLLESPGAYAARDLWRMAGVG